MKKNDKQPINLPQEGKEYWNYDDGKVTIGRQEIVRITRVVPYSQLSKDERDMIINETNEHDWLYDDVISHVVFGINLSLRDDCFKEEECEIIYLPSKGSWFGFNPLTDFNCGRLDIDGKLTQSLNEIMEYDSPLFPNE